MNEKKLEKLIKQLGKDTILELDAKSPEELKTTITEASNAMEVVDAELKANPKYQEAREALAALSQSKKEVNKRQKAKIAYSLLLLQSKGVVASPERE